MNLVTLRGVRAVRLLAKRIPQLERSPQVKLVRDNGDGSALYERQP